MTASLAQRLAGLGLHAVAGALDDLVAKATQKRWGPVDVLSHVADLETADRLREPLEQAGFPRAEHITTDDPKVGTDPALWEKRIHGSADPGRRVNLHVRVDGWPGQVFALAFRDWLRAVPAAREEYLVVKRKAETNASGLTGPDAISAYLDVKTPWFDEIYPRVLAWAERAD